METPQGMTITNRFWDCNCAENYIHSKDDSDFSCNKCGCEESDCSDSRLNEVIDMVASMILEDLDKARAWLLYLRDEIEADNQRVWGKNTAKT